MTEIPVMLWQFIEGFPAVVHWAFLAQWSLWEFFQWGVRNDWMSRKDNERVLKELGQGRPCKLCGTPSEHLHEGMCHLCFTTGPPWRKVCKQCGGLQQYLVDDLCQCCFEGVTKAPQKPHPMIALSAYVKEKKAQKEALRGGPSNKAFIELVKHTDRVIEKVDAEIEQRIETELDAFQRRLDRTIHQDPYHAESGPPKRGDK